MTGCVMTVGYRRTTCQARATLAIGVEPTTWLRLPPYNAGDLAAASARPYPAIPPSSSFFGCRPIDSRCDIDHRDRPGVTVHRNSCAVLDELRGVGQMDGGKPILSRQARGMRQQATGLDDDRADDAEHRIPAGIGRMSHQDFALLHAADLTPVHDDPRDPGCDAGTGRGTSHDSRR